MPAPNPGDYSDQQEFHGDCMEHYVGDEGYDQDQANAICYDTWRRSKAKAIMNRLRFKAGKLIERLETKANEQNRIEKPASELEDDAAGFDDWRETAKTALNKIERGEKLSDEERKAAIAAMKEIRGEE